jgi:hypothetical protein
MLLIATMRLIFGSRARNTTPIAPRPISSRISYRPKRRFLDLSIRQPRLEIARIPKLGMFAALPFRVTPVIGEIWNGSLSPRGAPQPSSPRDCCWRVAHFSGRVSDRGAPRLAVLFSPMTSFTKCPETSFTLPAREVLGRRWMCRSNAYGLWWRRRKSEGLLGLCAWLMRSRVRQDICGCSATGNREWLGSRNGAGSHTRVAQTTSWVTRISLVSKLLDRTTF